MEIISTSSATKTSFSQAAWTLLETLVVLAIITIVSTFIFPVERVWQHQLTGHIAASLLQKSCEEARAHAIAKRTTTWLLIGHFPLRQDAFTLLEETENGSLSQLVPWKELPKNTHIVFPPSLDTGISTFVRSQLPSSLLEKIGTPWSGIAWNSEGSIIAPKDLHTLDVIIDPTQKRKRLLFSKTSGRVFLMTISLF